MVLFLLPPNCGVGGSLQLKNQQLIRISSNNSIYIKNYAKIFSLTWKITKKIFYINNHFNFSKNGQIPKIVEN